MSALSNFVHRRCTGLLRCVVLLACFTATSADAASRALIMGSGEYVNNNILPNLPGIDLDMQSMHKVASELGYTADNVRELSGKQLTLANVQSAFAWLREGLGATDHALVYFSGHGYQIKDSSGDESDGYDEILPLYGYSGSNQEYLLDDNFQQLIAQLPSARTHVFIDACCSGSSDRDISLGEGLDGEKLVAKSVGCPSNSRNKAGGEPVGSDDFTDDYSKGAVFVGADGATAPQQALGEASRAQGNIMYMGAAQDDESAVASSRGSYFTRALSHAFAEHGAELSPHQLHGHARAYLIENLPPYRVHTPNLLGEQELQAQQAYYVVPGSGSSQGEQLQEAQPRYGKLDVLSQQQGAKLAVGGDIGVDFYLEKPGYINLLVIDAKGNTNVLFPNSFVPKLRRFEAGDHHLPEGFGIQTAKPLGQTDVWVVYSPAPMNLYQQSMQGKSVKIDGPFPVLSEQATRSLIRTKNSASAAQSNIKVGSVRFYVCDSEGSCQ